MTQERRNRLSLMCIVVMVAFAGGLEGARQPVRFPQTSEPAISPNGMMAVVNRDDDQRDPPHSLYLVDRRANGTETETKIYSYGRHVAVLWNADSTAIAITDYVGSDSSSCLVVRVPNGSVIDISASLENDPEAHQYVARDHHVYCEISRWVSTTAVAIELYGYGDAHPKGFRLTRRYQVGHN
jgi:hypothetical protein